MELYLGCTDVEQNIDCLALICCGLLGVLKTTWFRINPNSLINNYDSALNNYLAIDNTKDRDIMRRHAFIGRILCCFILGFSYLSCLIYEIIPFFLDYNQGNGINITNEDTILMYALPSRCALEYFSILRSMYKIFCLIESVIMILATTTNLGNKDLIFCGYFVCYPIFFLKTKIFLMNSLLFYIYMSHNLCTILK